MKPLVFLIVFALMVGSARAKTVAEWLFDETDSYKVINEVNDGDLPSMQYYGVTCTNLHAAGGRFPSSIGMMRTPTHGSYLAYLAYRATSSLDWTTITNLTIEMWINPNACDAVTDPIDYNGQGLRLVYNSNYGNYLLQGYIYDGKICHLTKYGTIMVATGVWTHIAMTYDGANLKTYVDGVLDCYEDVSGPLGNSGNGLNIGAYNGWINTFHGSIDEVRVSDVALPSGSGMGKGELAWKTTLVSTPSKRALLSTRPDMFVFQPIAPIVHAYQFLLCRTKSFAGQFQ